MNLELLAGLFGLGRTLLDNASEAVKTLLHSRFRIPFEALEWGTETVSADVVAATTGVVESELAQRVTAEALALADSVAITVQAFLERRDLLGEIEVIHSGWHRGDDDVMREDDDVMREVKGTYKGKRVRVARFVDSAGNAKLETVTVDGEARELLAFDVLLAEMLDELGQAKTAAKVRATPAEERGKRWKAATTPDGGPLGPRACLAVFRAVWAKLKDERDAPAYQLMHIEHGDERYVQAPKVTSGFAWAWGTTGERVGDDEYSQAPTVARYVSRSFGLTQGRLQQGLLPVEVQPEELAVRVVRDTQALISGMAGKAALLLSVASRHDGGLCRISVDELTRTLKPGARVQLRDKKAVVEAVRELRTVGVVLPNGVDLPLWQIAAPTPDRLGEGGDVLFAWSTLALAQELGATVASMWRGRFVLNLSGAMRIDARHPLELRAYVQTAAAWNEARRGPQSVFKPELTLKGTAEELAVRFNALSPAAVQAKLERGGKSRSVLSDDKARVVQALERLSDEDKLIRLEKKGGVYQLLPPEPLLEAHELMREHGQRTDGRPGK